MPYLRLLFHVSILKATENTLFTHFQNQLGLARLFLPVFNFDWRWRESFLPFSKSIGPCESLFSRFQNRLGVGETPITSIRIGMFMVLVFL